MSSVPAPPPRRTHTPTASTSTTIASTPTWKDKVRQTSTVWGKKAIDQSVKISDKVGERVNTIAENRFGTEAFWPVTGDMAKEMDKCARILRAFTVDGVVVTEKSEDPSTKTKKPKKVLRKVPPEVIRQAKGVAIFTSMRTGFAPFGGAGGAGLVMARLEDGSWSAPASISPNNLSAGLLIGVDVYDCLLILRTQTAVDSFSTHKFTLGAEIAVAAGPYGAGAAVESGKEGAPVFSYVKSKGLYAGVEVVGQVFVERFDENGMMYHWKGVKAGDILSGKVRVPVEAARLHEALRDAETGRAQALHNNGQLDVPIDSETTDLIHLEDGEVLKLPPTPDQTDGTEHESDPETERLHVQHEDQHVQAPAPRLPPRRPVMLEQHSSASFYSTAEAEPALERGTENKDGGDEISEKVEGLIVAPEEEVMSESEKKEWEQFLAEHKDEGLR